MLDNLYANIGGKIKSLAKWTFIVNAALVVLAGVIAAFVAFFTAIAAEEFEPLLAIFAIPWAAALEIVVAWVATWTLYAFGELVERVCLIEEKLDGSATTPSNGNATTPSNGSSYSERLKQIADEKSAVPNKVTPPKNDEWYCPDCDLHHKSYVGTCGCGRQRPNAAAPKAPHPSKPAPQPKAEEAEKPAPTLKADEWYCPECGLVHKAYVGSCGCGRHKP